MVRLCGISAALSKAVNQGKDCRIVSVMIHSNQGRKSLIWKVVINCSEILLSNHLNWKPCARVQDECFSVAAGVFLNVHFYSL